MNIDYSELCLVSGSPQVTAGEGRNVIPPPKEKPLWVGFLEKFKDPLIVVLLVVFFLSVAISLYEIFFAGRGWTTLIEPLGVLMALLLATGVGFIFEVRAEREFKVLNKKKDERMVKVLRLPADAGAGPVPARNADVGAGPVPARNADVGAGPVPARNADVGAGPVPARNLRPQMLQVKKSDVVVGDVVRLESGDEVPADGRLLKAETLTVDESAFTGEMYATKGIDLGKDKEEAYPSDFLLRGSIVLEGHCLYRVTATGMDTEEGRGAKILREESTVRTPLNQQLDDLGRWITWGSYIIAALIVIGRMAYYFLFDGDHANNTDIVEMLTFMLNSVLIAVTLIVVAVPEGLPMSVTVSLAMSMRRMLKENNLVRKLHACETMGATTVICTDKTGTLTKNKLRVMEDSEVLYTDVADIARAIAVNSTAELSVEPGGKLRTVGNPTEGSLLYWLKRRKDLDYRDLRDTMTITRQEAFSSETKRMATFATDNATGRRFRFVKGAPEVVLDLCDDIAGGHSREEVNDGLARLQAMGRRTLAFAEQEIIDGQQTPLLFTGFVGMADPVRDDVRQAVDTCHSAGVNIIMVTGDVALTACQIARETGIISDEMSDSQLLTPNSQLLTPNSSLLTLTGAEFEQLTDDDIKRRVLPTLKVLSRARPADKARLVTLLQETGQVVAVTGDGTNDAPALKKAQVGLSMGDGTARAKEASDITIIDNSFSSINTAILWGRSLYLNIQRFILFQMTINVCACLIVLAGAFTGLDSPLNVTQMLWVNLIMDTFAAMALSSLPPDARVMHDRPRHVGSHIVTRAMAKRIAGVGLLFFTFLFGLWQLLWHSDIHCVHDLGCSDVWRVYVTSFFDFTKSKQHLSPYELGLFFTFFVLMQFWNLFNARYFRTGRSLIRDLRDIITRRASFSRHYSTGFVFIAVVIIIGQVLIVSVFGDMFGVAPLSLADWLWLALYTCPILVVGEIARLFHKR